MVVEYENLKGVKPLNESKSKIERDIIMEIKMLEEDDDLNANYLSEVKELIKEHFSRLEEINEKIREICIKVSLNTEKCGKFRQGITKRLSVLSQTLFTNKNAPSRHSRHNLSKGQILLKC